MVTNIVKYTVVYLLIVVGLVTAQWLMDVPSSGGDMSIFFKHTLGIWLAFFTGAFWVVNTR